MRYEVVKGIDKETGEEVFEFTHIKEMETIDGERVEVIWGKNEIKEENLRNSLAQVKEDRDNQFKVVDDNVKTMEEMLKALEEVK